MLYTKFQGSMFLSSGEDLQRVTTGLGVKEQKLFEIPRDQI